MWWKENKRRTELLARFVCAIEGLVEQNCFATKRDLQEMEARLMATIKEFSDKVNASFDKVGLAVDGVMGDVQWLKDKITELQNSPGAITPEDQALLDAIEDRANQLVTKVETLDAATEHPPTP